MEQTYVILSAFSTRCSRLLLYELCFMRTLGFRLKFRKRSVKAGVKKAGHFSLPFVNGCMIYTFPEGKKWAYVISLYVFFSSTNFLLEQVRPIWMHSGFVSQCLTSSVNTTRHPSEPRVRFWRPERVSSPLWNQHRNFKKKKKAATYPWVLPFSMTKHCVTRS